MSKYNNVNPGQYKVAGRERPDTIAKARQKNTPTVTQSNKRASKGRTSAKQSKSSSGR